MLGTRVRIKIIIIVLVHPTTSSKQLPNKLVRAIISLATARSRWEFPFWRFPFFFSVRLIRFNDSILNCHNLVVNHSNQQKIKFVFFSDILVTHSSHWTRYVPENANYLYFLKRFPNSAFTFNGNNSPECDAFTTKFVYMNDFVCHLPSRFTSCALSQFRIGFCSHSTCRLSSFVA